MGSRVVLALLLIPAISPGVVEDRVRPALEVRKADDSLLVTYTVENVSGATLRFFYNDAQQYDFALSADGREIWRWSAQMAFAQVIWEDSLAPGASVVVEERLPWPQGREALEMRAWLSCGPGESTAGYVGREETLVRIRLFEETEDGEAGRSDFDGSGTVDFEDFFALTAAFGTSRGDPGFQSGYDLDGDGEVGIPDFFLFASSFGMIVPSPED
ncbi:MAG: BsuPI-related putative proteinase inhibitor [Gemmatimonadaceae bacterium]|nr:BsuPI-related putative proteinase inhibitor [Gemmatimonadaceae bacterium]